MDNKEITSLGKTDATPPLVVQNSVYDSLTFAPKIVRFSRKQYQFLNAFRLGVPLHEAAAKAELTTDQVERFLARTDVREWLEDRALMHHIKTEWEEPGKWWALGNDVLEGKRELNKAQIVVFQEFGQRAVPKRVEVSGNAPKVVVNVSVDAVKEAFKRQEAIDGELSQ